MFQPAQSQFTAEASADFWFINSLVTLVSNSAATEGSFSIYRQVAPFGFATPYHKHEAYGEGFYVLDGEVTFFCDGKKTVLAKEASFIFQEPSRTGFA